MTWVDLLLAAIAGVWAGMINTVVGSGSLVTFPTLLALGLPPVMANTTNNIGLVPGSISGTVGMLPEVKALKHELIRLGPLALLGGLAGALLLLWLPSSAFDTIVPILVAIGCILVVLQPWLTQKMAARAGRLAAEGRPPSSRKPWWPLPAIALSSTYGGYFGAAQGLLHMAILSLAMPDESWPRLNALKNALASIINFTAAIVFILVAPVSWPYVGALAVGSVIGGQLGARVGRRLPAVAYRVIIVVIGVIAIINQLVK
ncbi:sulfite exporter TauE/SafE family protein [Enemella evansiae]|uniref:sulfite exporter TauE/SafE family protein n=1 Tax=Enemella evansiae TaxID=2016499 RepID=UPI000B97A1B0|nr:sulfite exporter TauE/SafE family protein [Enemella evansiae]OYO04216.1 hypothetical protein CGZ97_12730 [Enemella evansiae]